MGYKARDVEVVFLNEELCLVTACDSCGAIGEKELDVVSVPASVSGQFITRVALLELLASGATLQMISVTIANEPDPTGEQILAGVRAELKAVGLAQTKIVMSMEKNMPTRQTAFGISAIGICPSTDLRLGRTLPGDYLYGLGKPKVGPEVNDPVDPEIIQTKDLLSLLKNQSIHDLIPVGSRGIRYECELLERSLGVKVEYQPDCPIPLTKSAGPSTALIFSTPVKIDASNLRKFGLDACCFKQIEANKLPFFEIGQVR